MIRLLRIGFLFLYVSATGQNLPEAKLLGLGIVLPTPSTSNANSYINLVRTGNIVYLSGKGPIKNDGSYPTGKLGSELTTEQGYQAARLCALQQLAALKKEYGELSKIKRVIKVSGYVNCTDDFYQQPKVIDGFSDLILEIFGLAGQHVRTATGTNSLPFNWPVEVDMIVEIIE